MQHILSQHLPAIHDVIERKKLKLKFNHDLMLHHLSVARALEFDIE